MTSLSAAWRLIWERSLTPRECWQYSSDEPPTLDQIEQARQTAQRWAERLTPLFGDSGLFQRRLEGLGLTADNAWTWWVCATPPSDAALPPWIDALDAALSSINLPFALLPDEWHLFDPEEAAAYPQTPDTTPLFPQILAPNIAWSLQQLVERPHCRERLSETALLRLARNLLYRLSIYSSRVLASEVKARSRRAELTGASPGERYQYFITPLSTAAGQIALFLEYPVLARLLGETCLRWVGHVERLLQRLKTDAEVLARRGLVAEHAEQVAALEIGLSDPHRGGQTVAVLRFVNGERLVYKPRSMRGDEAFARIVDWWNELQVGQTLRAPRAYDRGEYGWCEHVSTAPCASRAEVQAYFRRQGQWTALLYFLNGTDFHAENFLAAGADPVPIDLEALMAPWPGKIEGRYWDLPAAFRPVGFSPFTTSMLPTWVKASGHQPCHLVAGLCGTAQRKWPSLLTDWRGLETDQLTPRPRLDPLEYENCLPLFQGERMAAEEYLPQICEGFATAYQTVQDRRDDFLKPGGLLSLFENVAGRCVMRHTMIYKDVLHRSLYPDNLRSGAAYEASLEAICLSPLLLESEFFLADREKAQLRDRDVPCYYGFPQEVTLRDSWGASIADLPTEPAMQIARRRIEQADEGEKEWFLEMLPGSLRMALAMGPEAAVRLADAAEPNSESAAPHDDELLHAAVALGTELEKLALCTSWGAAWMQLYQPGVGKEIHFTHGGPYLYQGSSGVALFFANLASATGDSRWAKLAVQGLDFAVAMAARIPWETYHAPRPPRGIDGPLSIAYALAESGRLLQEPGLIQRGRQWALDCTTEPISASCPWDLAGGTVGEVLKLLYMHQQTGERAFRDRACARGERLLIEPDIDDALLGIAHGLAGLLLSLDRLEKIAPHQRRSERKERVLERLSASYSVEYGHWPDLRNKPEGFQVASGWCAGAPGLGLSYLSLYGDSSAAERKEGIERAIHSTQRLLDSEYDHLCCGQAARIWFLTQAGQQLQRPGLLEAGRNAALGLLRTRAAEGTWDFGFREKNGVSSLFRGIAGLGLTFLQARNPGSVSPVLTLE